MTSSISLSDFSFFEPNNFEENRYNYNHKNKSEFESIKQLVKTDESFVDLKSDYEKKRQEEYMKSPEFIKMIEEKKKEQANEEGIDPRKILQMKIKMEKAKRKGKPTKKQKAQMENGENSSKKSRKKGKRKIPPKLKNNN